MFQITNGKGYFLIKQPLALKCLNSIWFVSTGGKKGRQRQILPLALKKIKYQITKLIRSYEIGQRKLVNGSDLSLLVYDGKEST